MRTVRRPVLALLVIAASVGLAACGGGPGSGPDAARLVLAEQPRFGGIGARDDNLIGQAAWYEVRETADGWQVEVRIGWGDCPAGCINEHRWHYAVTRDGQVGLLSEDGDPLLGGTGVTGTASAGPTCPVVRDPPDPACADRPVAGATLIVTDGAGREAARITTDAEGGFWLELAPGAYRLAAQPMEGLMGTPEPIEFQVVAEGPPVEVTVNYDTGIR